MEREMQDEQNRKQRSTKDIENTKIINERRYNKCRELSCKETIEI